MDLPAEQREAPVAGLHRLDEARHRDDRDRAEVLTDQIGTPNPN